jgi:hypothetical protein
MHMLVYKKQLLRLKTLGKGGYYNPSLALATKARACKGTGQEGSLGVWESVRMNTHSQVNSHFGSWSPDGFPNFQRAITGV